MQTQLTLILTTKYHQLRNNPHRAGCRINHDVKFEQHVQGYLQSNFKFKYNVLRQPPTNKMQPWIRSTQSKKTYPLIIDTDCGNDNVTKNASAAE